MIFTWASGLCNKQQSDVRSQLGLHFTYWSLKYCRLDILVVSTGYKLQGPEFALHDESTRDFVTEPLLVMNSEFGSVFIAIRHIQHVHKVFVGIWNYVFSKVYII